MMMIWIGSGERQYQIARTGGYTFAGPLETGEPTPRSKIVVENKNTQFLETHVRYLRLSIIIEVCGQTETWIVTEKTGKIVFKPGSIENAKFSV